jgi:hypothetical protein
MEKGMGSTKTVGLLVLSSFLWIWAFLTRRTSKDSTHARLEALHYLEMCITSDR